VADYDVIVKRLEPMRVVALSADLAGYDEIGATCDRMYPRLQSALIEHGVPFGGLSVALYEDTGDETRPLRITTALPVPAGVTIDAGELATIELAAVERAATTVVRGDPAQFPGAFRALHEWIDQTGARATAFERELYIDCDGPRDTWVTELQVLMEPAQVASHLAGGRG
jgi:effector-binding domain-containing protein